MAKKNLGKRILAAILSIVMCFSAVQIQVFADTEENHVMPGSFVLDENGNVTGTTNETTNSAHGFTVSKTAKQTGKNAFDITLRVQTSTTVVTDDAAIVLVVDASNSMNTGRLSAVKSALTKNGGFVDSLANNQGKIFLSVVVFNNGAYTVVDWTELNDANKASIKQSINGISCSAGTNLEAGLMLARNKLGQDVVASCGNKYTVLLSDGAPSKWMDRDSTSTSTISSGINSALSEGHAETISGSREMAAAVKALSTLYTICYGASNNQLVDGQEICAHCEKEEDDHIDLCEHCQKTRNEHNRSGSRRYCSGYSGTTYKAASYCDASGENKYEAKTVNGMTVGQFLANEVATAPAYAYDADDEAAVNAAFSAVATSASSGMTGAGTTVTDPMGQFIVLGDVSSLSTVTAAGNALTWNLDESTLVDTVVSGNTTTYTYEITYPITLDTAAEGFEEKDENGETRYYPTNKYTYLSVVTDNGTVKIPFNVPGVSGTVPMIPYSVEYYLQGNAAAGAYDQYTLNATQEMPAVKAWTVGSAPAGYADKYSASNYSFAYGEPTVQVIPEGENVIKLYYNRDLAEVTVNHFYKTDVINSLGQVTPGTYPTAPQATATQKAYVGDAYQAELALNYGGHPYVLESADPAQNLTVSAEGGNVINLYYTRNTYTYSYGVVYDGNGGQLALGATTYNDDENLSETDKTSHIIKVDVNTFVRPNYEFIGWSDSPKGDVIFSAGDSIEFTATGTKTLYAQWKAIPYNVSYEYVGNIPANAPAVPAGSTHIAGENVAVSGNPTLANYTFSGWTTSDAEIADGSFVMPGKDVKLVGSWTAIPYSVTYVYTGNVPANAPALPAGGTFYAGDKVTVAAEAVLEHYTFSGWTTGHANVENGSFVMPGNDVILEGSWTEHDKYSYAVNYYGNGGVLANDETWYGDSQNAQNTYTNPYAIDVDANTFVYAHHIFLGWTEEPNGEVVYKAGDSIAFADSGSKTLYAKWEAIPYNVSYEYIGNVPANAPAVPAGSTHIVGENVTVAGNPSVANYTFSGWTTTDAEVINGSFAMPGKNVKLVGSWTAIPYNVTYKYVGTIPANAPILPAGSTHIAGENVAVAGNPILANYTFSGWTTSDAEIADGSFVMPGKDVELIGSWTAIPYNVSYEYVGNIPANAPALPAGSTHIVGENVTVAGNPTLVNYTFSGWTTSDAAIADGSFVMPGKDVKLVGSWTAIPYNVSYEYVGTIPANAPAVPAGSTHIAGENVAVSGNPTLVNYTFSGWTTSDAEIADGSFVMPGKDVKLVGSWTAIPYSVTYVYTGNVPANAPAVPAGGTFYAGDKVTVAAEAVLEHYTFSGWSTGHANVENGSFVMPGNDVILEGSWTEHDKYSYAVNYYGNGGVLANDETWYGDSQNAQNTYTNPYTIYVDENTFVREHYQFVGWTEEPNGNVVYKAGDGIGFTASGTKTLYAKWKAIPYNVSYEYVGTVPANAPALPEGSTHVIGENVTVAGNPTVANYTFSGWTTSDADVINGSFAMPGKDVKLVGSWTENPKYGYTLTYVGNGGKLSNNETTYNDSQSVTAIYNTTYAMSADSNTFERPTYRFIGWNTQADGKGVSYAAGDEITFTVQENTKTLYAQWEAIAYNVTYVYTGKVPAGVPALPEGATYIAGSKVAVAQNAALEGYIFSGWTTADAAIADGSFVMPGQDVVLEGSWVARPVYDYTVVYNANFGETPATKADEQNAQRIYDAAYTIDVNSNSFVRENYTFIGWAAQANGDVVYQAGDQIHFEKGGVKILYARWIENDKFSYTVIYNGNGGALKSGELAYGDSENVEQTYATAHQIRVDGNSFLRANYTFIGWNTAADGTGTAYTAEEIIKLTSEDNTRTLYAQWKENAKYAYELIYNANFGETPATKADEENVAQTYATSYKITVNENTFVRDNYTFIGWNTAADGTGTAYAAGSAVALTAEINTAVLYAQWKENPKYAFELTYNANFGEAPETSADEENVAQTYATSHKITVNENAFVREHYTFIGWNTAADGTGTAYKAGSELALTVENNTAVLYAQWEINEYDYVVEYKVRLEDAAYEAFTGELPEGAPLGGKLIYGASIEAEKLQLPKALSDDEYTYDYTTVEISQREDFTTVVTVYYTAELVDIPDEEPPLADVPETGDASIFYTVLTTLSGLGLATLALKKKEETEE